MPSRCCCPVPAAWSTSAPDRAASPPRSPTPAAMRAWWPSTCPRRRRASPGTPRGGAVDLVVANPPYMLARDWPTLPREVRDWEPRIALDGGADGTALLRRIVADAPRVLAPGGALIVETGGESHVDVVARAFEISG